MIIKFYILSNRPVLADTQESNFQNLFKSIVCSIMKTPLITGGTDRMRCSDFAAQLTRPQES